MVGPCGEHGPITFDGGIHEGDPSMTDARVPGPCMSSVSVQNPSSDSDPYQPGDRRAQKRSGAGRLSQRGHSRLSDRVIAKGKTI